MTKRLPHGSLQRCAIWIALLSMLGTFFLLAAEPLYSQDVKPAPAPAVEPAPAPAVEPADGERSILKPLGAPASALLGEPVVVSCLLPEPAKGKVAYSWRMDGPPDVRFAFVEIEDGRVVHAWGEPGDYQIELARMGPGDKEIKRYTVDVRIAGSPPPPDPVDEFSRRVRETVTLEKDRKDIAVLADVFAGKLRDDKSIATTADMGAAWAELQRRYHESDAPYGDRLGAFEQLVAASLTDALGLTGDALPLDADGRREKAAAWFKQLAGALQ